MSLSIRHPKGVLSRRWYWDCRINDRSVSVGLCKIRGVPPREWSLSVPDWSLAHKGDAAFERSRAEAIQMAPDAVARKREELDRTPRAIMEEALKRAQGKKRRRIPTIRTLHADYVADTERLLAKKRAAGKSVGELVLKRRNLKRFCEWWFAHRRGLANKSIIEVSRGDAEEFVEFLQAPDRESGLRRKVVTVEKMRKHLKNVFDRMLPEGSANPFDLDPIPKEESEEAHPAVLDERELGLVAETARERDLLIHDLAMLSINTSLRKGDCCTLRWEDVQLDETWKDRNGGVHRGVIRRVNRKTNRMGLYPFTEMIRLIVDRRLSERKPGDEYVFEEAAELYRRNPKGLTYRLQKVFVDALGAERGIFVEDGATEDVVPLAEILGEVKAKVGEAPLGERKRAATLGMLDLYARGMSFNEIAARTGRGKSLVSLYLNDAQALVAPKRFIKRVTEPRFGYRKAIDALTMAKAPVGMKRDSELNFMTFRTSFVTILRRKGVSADFIKRFTAHTSTRMIDAIYDRSNALDYAEDVLSVLPKTVTSDEGMLPYRGPAVEAEGESLPADGGGARARALPAPKALPPVPVRASGKAASLAEIVNRLSAEDKEKLKSLSKEEKADLRRLKSLEDIEAFLALC